MDKVKSDNPTAQTQSAQNRRQRLAAALRENLQKRKAQARRREQAPDDDALETPDDEAIASPQTGCKPPI